MLVLCWDCPDTYEIAPEVEYNHLSRGLIKRRIENDLTSDWLGLCPRCTTAHARADDPSKTIPTKRKRVDGGIQAVYDATRNILLTADELREDDLSLSREESIHLAVDLHFAPELEVNPTYREYLIWRSTR